MNGTLRKAIVTGLVGLVFLALTTLGGIILGEVKKLRSDLDALRSETYYVKAIATRRSERVENLEQRVGQCEARQAAAETRLAVLEEINKWIKRLSEQVERRSR